MEQRDIRDLFKNSEEEEKNLQLGHREEFLEKLKVEQLPKTNNYVWMKIAVVLVVSLFIGYGIFKKEPIENPSTLLVQIQAVEAEYLKNINVEWSNFIKQTKDERLIKRYTKRLEELDKDYQEISEAFKKDNSNILVVEALVENLKTRLDLLRDIIEHIEILNQNNEQHENTI